MRNLIINSIFMKTKVQVFEERIQHARSLLRIWKISRDEFKEYFKKQANTLP
jgi:hypothetical protein